MTADAPEGSDTTVEPSVVMTDPPHRTAAGGNDNNFDIARVRFVAEPPKWRAKLAQVDDTCVTVGIEEETRLAQTASNDVLGIWRDRKNVMAYVCSNHHPVFRWDDLHCD